MMRLAILAFILLAAPAAAQVTGVLPVTCNPNTTICVTSTPVTNPDGTLIGAGAGGSSTRTTAAGTSDTQAVPVQGVAGGVPQPTTVTNTPTVNLGTIGAVSTEATQLAVSAKLPASVGAKTGAASLSVVPASDGFSVTPRGVATLATTQVSVGTTATLIVAARTARGRLIVTQSAAGPCYYGPTNTVSATTGARLIAAGGSKVYLYAGALYGICPGAAVTTDVDEEY